MPSSPNYVRDLKREKETSDARGEKPKRAVRNRARRKLEKLGMVKKGDGKDVDHIKPLVKGGAGDAASNLRVRSASANRSFKRTKDGGMK